MFCEPRRPHYTCADHGKPGRRKGHLKACHLPRAPWCGCTKSKATRTRRLPVSLDARSASPNHNWPAPIQNCASGLSCEGTQARYTHSEQRQSSLEQRRMEQQSDNVRRLRSLPQDMQPPYDWVEFRCRARQRANTAARREVNTRTYLAIAAAFVLVVFGVAAWMRGFMVRRGNDRPFGISPTVSIRAPMRRSAGSPVFRVSLVVVQCWAHAPR